MNSETGGRVLITGAAGNLGGMLARHLREADFPLRLMVHRTPLPDDLYRAKGVQIVSADLGQINTLPAAVANISTVVHFAGVLFAPRPERFLPTTNTLWFKNLLSASLTAGVSKIILISFPHVEGESTLESPAMGEVTGVPRSVHARTRLEEERLLLSETEGTSTSPLILRLGMVYGRGVLMIDAARWLAERHLLAVWNRPTWIHLLAKEDFLRATQAAVESLTVRGIYHVGDDVPITLQEFLDRACDAWGVPRPWRLPTWMIYGAACICELTAAVFSTPAPLTRDFITIGRESYFGDTSRTKKELIPNLLYPDLQSGLKTL